MNLLVIVILVGYILFIYKQHANFDGNDEDKSPQALVKFGFLTFYTQKNILRAYVYLGLELMRKDRGDLRNQQQLFLALLSRRFASLDRHEITKIYLKIMRHFGKVDLESVYAWLKKHSKPGEKENLLNLLSDLAYHNDKVTTSEFKFIYASAEKVGLSLELARSIIALKQERLNAKFRSASAAKESSSETKRKQKIHILGLSGKPTFEAIKKAYRDLAKKYHPDRFHNSSNYDKEQAHERFIAIKNAYDYLMRDL